MRILANYGYKNNGDNYSVTFETVGDVAKEQADIVVDELFAMGKAAIERQIGAVGHVVKEKEEIPISLQPLSPEQDKKKPHLKDPGAPATKKQKSFIVKLAKDKGVFIDNLNDFTMEEASEKIGELMTV